jgi:hypothetical protein
MEDLAREARENDIYPVFVKFPMEVWGVLYKCSQGHYHVGINKNLTRNMQKKVLLHEIKHIEDHLPSSPYLIGLNMQHSELEQGTEAAVQKMFTG